MNREIDWKKLKSDRSKRGAYTDLKDKLNRQDTEISRLNLFMTAIVFVFFIALVGWLVGSIIFYGQSYERYIDEINRTEEADTDFDNRLRLLELKVNSIEVREQFRTEPAPQPEQ